MAWTVNDTDVGALDDGIRSPDWQRQARLTTLELSGTGRSQTYRTGYSPYTMRMPVWFVSSGTKTLLDGLLGQEVTVDDGTTEWTATLATVAISPLIDGNAGYEGELTFLRSAS